MKAKERENLWASYRKNPSSEIREQIILEYAPLVKVVAGRLSMYLGYNVEYDDLVGYGIFGLIDAIDKYDAGKDVKFETYASLRIRGSILDQIRKIAFEIGITEEELSAWQSQLKITNIVSLNEYVEQGSEPVMDAHGNSHFIQPEEKIQENELKKVLKETLGLLTEKERRVIELYYYEELTLKEISRVLGVTESRISQLHTKALLKMRKKMGNYMDIFVD